MKLVLLALFTLYSDYSLACQLPYSSSLNLLSGALEDQWTTLKENNSAWELDSGILNSKQDYFGVDLVSHQRFENFILTFEFRFSHAANSGIKYLIQDKHGNIGLEYQIVDDQNNKDNKTPKTQSGALYDIFPPENKTLFEENKYNHGCIVFKDGFGEHWLNGKKILSYELNSPKFQKAVKNSKFRKFDWFGNYKSGKILIQHHGDQVFFKNLHLYAI